MKDDALKSIYINMYLLAAADGQTHPAEVEYLRRFAELAGISPVQAEAWRAEVTAGATQFREIRDIAVAGEYLGVMARMVRVDGVFDETEQSAYIAMGKTLGFTHEQLGEALREHWDKDPLERFASPTAPTTETVAIGAVVIVQDDMIEQTTLEASAQGIPLTRCSMEALGLGGLRPDMIVFHAAEDRQTSLDRLAWLKETFPDSFVAFIARRDQAPQIGHLLEKGADRCFVEPLYPNELAKGILEVTDKNRT